MDIRVIYKHHIRNYLTQDGKTPQEISALARRQVENYETVKFYEGLAVSGIKTANGFEVTTDAEYKFTASKLIVATGIKDIMSDIKGFSECWGISVIHCPYCHGYEFRYQKTAILANGSRAIHLASLVNNLSSKLAILTSGNPDFDNEQIVKLQKNKIEIIEPGITEIVHEKGQVKNVIFKDDSVKVFDAIYATIPFVQNSDIPVKLGCELSEEGFIKVNAFQQTSVSGIYACGDNTTFIRSVANAVAAGNFAGAMVNKELCDEHF
ncbi:NAD(P)/FAD-dependent oxidoreductase [Algoriphagus resistens]|uniref:NAD(P)/FAD-dependent oxidoreductase n=1 Tax=Algoriphagus resistens TaxID=1750590 RepID=UPI000AFB78B6|nr:NAD(P)/FAD-dependent oxidoreductase [Algoriphagus resistens]